MKRTSMLLGCALLVTSLAGGQAQAQTTLRMTWYSDGNEGEVMSDLLRRFEEQNKDIKVVLDQVPFKAINENLPVQLAAGQGPDLARVADLGGVARYTLDLRPHLKDPTYFETNFGPFLEWMRVPGDTTSIPGFMTQLTLTGPFVNKTLFEQANVPIPGPKATWEEWGKAAKDVAAKVQAPFPIAIDRSGHRFFSLAITQGAKLFNEKSEPAVLDEGFKRDAQVVMYESGSWQIGQFDKTIGDAFDWVAVPTPCGPANCSGMPGGAALVAIKTTKSPQAVARLLEYLASETIAREFYERSLFVPGHLGLAKKGLGYKGASPQGRAALTVFGEGVAQLSPVANKLQGYVNNRVMFNAVISRLGQAIVGEATLDEAYRRITADVEQQIAERNKK